MGIFSEKLRPGQDPSNDVDSVFNDYMFKDVEFKDMQGNTHTGTVSAVHFATDEYDDDYLVIYSDEGNEVLKRPKDVKLIETLEECFNDTLIGPQQGIEDSFKRSRKVESRHKSTKSTCKRFKESTEANTDSDFVIERGTLKKYNGPVKMLLWFTDGTSKHIKGQLSDVDNIIMKYGNIDQIDAEVPYSDGESGMTDRDGELVWKTVYPVRRGRYYESSDKRYTKVIKESNEEDSEKPEFFFEGFNYSGGPDDDEDDDDEDVSNFTEIASKTVEDSDGFLTDYTMYRDTETGEYVFVFGDKDAYSPEDGNFDWSCDTEKEAWDWFNSYTGLDEDELAEGVSDPDFAKSSAVKDNSADSDEDEKLQESPHAIGNATDIAEDEVVLSNYLGYTLTETNVYYEGKDIDEVYYIVIAPDGNVMTEDFYTWAEVEGLDFDSLSTSDKVARFADYVDSIKQ